METLNTEGFLITEIAGEWSVLKVNYGCGYGAAACVGAPEGTRNWTIKIDVLPHDQNPRLVEGRTRAAYLWQFYRDRKIANDEPFWIEVEDPAEGTRKNFLASFAEHRLSFEVLCARIYATGLQLRERRVIGVPSPVS